jgi:hypothetical protein
MRARRQKMSRGAAALLAVVVTGCVPNPSLTSRISPVSALVAVQEIALPDLARMDVDAGSVVFSSKPGCAVNPPIYVIAGDGVSESAIQGDYVLSAAAGNDGSAVIATLLDPNTFGNNATGATDALVVLDTITSQAGSWQSQSGEVEKLFAISQLSGSMRLAAKAIEFSVCRAADRTPPEAALQIVTSKSNRESVWVTQLPLDPASEMALRILGDPNASSSAREQALGTLGSIEHAEGSAVAVAAAPSSMSADWTSRYTARGGAWDRCARLPTDQQNIRCSAGASFNLVGLVPGGIRIFGPDTERYVRLRLNSNPAEASIFSGAVRQPSRTNTSMDILAEELPKLRLEKVGFQPCPYGPRWVIQQLGTSRKTLQATCNLIPTAKRKRR